MTRLVLLQFPIGLIDSVRVRVGEETIGRATGLTPEMINLLAPDDHHAIEEALS